MKEGSALIETCPSSTSNASDDHGNPGVETGRSQGRLLASPPIRRWSTVLIVVWAALPAILVAPSVWFSHVRWPPAVEVALDYGRTIGLYGSPVILFLWSMQVLRQRDEEHWKLKSIPLTVSMIAINASVIFGGGRLGRGAGAFPSDGFHRAPISTLTHSLAASMRLKDY